MMIDMKIPPELAGVNYSNERVIHDYPGEFVFYCQFDDDYTAPPSPCLWLRKDFYNFVTKLDHSFKLTSNVYLTIDEKYTTAINLMI